jgi:hypothetical protein
VASTIKIKRSGVAGKQPNTSTISVGELAINFKDQKLYSSNGTAVFQIGGGGGGDFDFGTFANTVTNPIMYFLNQLGMDLGSFSSPAGFNLDLESF